MRVEITEALADGSVRFESAAGAARARWHGVARAGQWDVELEIPDEVLAWTALEAATGSISGAGEQARITGRIAGFDPADQLVTLEVANGLALVEIVAPTSEIRVGAWLSFSAELHLYPVSL